MLMILTGILLSLYLSVIAVEYAEDRAKDAAVLGCWGDLVSRLSSSSYGASYGSLCGLIGDTNWTY